MRTTVVLAASFAAAVVVVACGTDDRPAAVTPSSTGASADATVIDPGDDGDYRVDIDPEAFSSTVDHPYLPMLPGTRWVYEGRSDDGEVEIITVEVLDEFRIVMGVETVVVRDVVENEDGELVEDTHDWYARHDDGSVWYFGEDTTSYEDGAASTAGAWEAGVDGALPGVVMPAVPAPSAIGYRQEFLAGAAEDMGQVIATDGAVSVPFGDFTEIVVTRDWTPLEPDVVEEKSYARDVGFVYEVKTSGEGAGEEVVLVEFTPPE